MDQKDRAKFADCVKRWEARANRFEEKVRGNGLFMLSVKEVLDDMTLLLVLASAAVDSGRSRPGEKALGRLKNLDLEWQEFEQNNRRDYDADRRVPFGLGRLVHDVRFLAGLASPAPETAPAA